MYSTILENVDHTCIWHALSKPVTCNSDSFLHKCGFIFLVLFDLKSKQWLSHESLIVIFSQILFQSSSSCFYKLWNCIYHSSKQMLCFILKDFFSKSWLTDSRCVIFCLMFWVQKQCRYHWKATNLFLPRLCKTQCLFRGNYATYLIRFFLHIHTQTSVIQFFR